MQDLANIIKSNARTHGDSREINFEQWTVIPRGEGYSGFDRHTGETGPAFATREQALAWAIGRQATGDANTPVGLGIKPLHA
jgi:hypothetical protein